MTYVPSADRYKKMQYRRCGNSGIKLPAISLGLWHNFGHVDVTENYRKILHLAFDSGITHFDLANNYGPPPGSAEENFGRILKEDFRGYRDEMIISSKVLAMLPKNATYYFCKPDIPRGLDAGTLKQKAESFNLQGETYPSVKEALQNAQQNASDNDLVFVGGSTFVVAEVVWILSELEFMELVNFQNSDPGKIP